MTNRPEPSPVPATPHYEHRDSGKRCLAGHQEGDWRNPTPLPPCIICTCGEHVRPEKWDAHTNVAPVPAVPAQDVSNEQATWMIEEYESRCRDLEAATSQSQRQRESEYLTRFCEDAFPIVAAALQRVTRERDEARARDKDAADAAAHNARLASEMADDNAALRSRLAEVEGALTFAQKCYVAADLAGPNPILHLELPREAKVSADLLHTLTDAAALARPTTEPKCETCGAPGTMVDGVPLFACGCHARRPTTED